MGYLLSIWKKRMSENRSNIKLITAICLVGFLGFSGKYGFERFEEYRKEKDIRVAKMRQEWAKMYNETIPDYIRLRCLDDDAVCAQKLTKHLSVKPEQYPQPVDRQSQWLAFIYDYHLKAHTDNKDSTSSRLFCLLKNDSHSDTINCDKWLPPDFKKRVFGKNPECIKHAFKKYPHWKPLNEWTDKEMLEIPLLPKHNGYWEAMDGLAFEYLKASPDTFCTSIMK